MVYLAVAFFWGVWGAFLYFGHFWIGLCVAVLGLAIVGFLVGWWVRDCDTREMPTDHLRFDDVSAGNEKE